MSFDPCSCVRRIGPECIGSYFVPGWTTIETILKEAVDRWFAVFKIHFRWIPQHNGHIRENFHRKCAKIISDGWHKMRVGKSKYPKWVHPDVIKRAKEIFAESDKIKVQSERGKLNYKGLKSGRGPSRHRGGPKPMQVHFATMAKQLKWQPYPAEIYKRMKVAEDGTFLERRGVDVLQRLEESQRQLQSRYLDADELPEDELVECAAQVVGISHRTGMPRLYCAVASLVEGSRFGVTPSQASTVQGPTTSEQPSAKEMARMVDSRVDSKVESLRTELLGKLHEIKEFMRTFSAAMLCPNADASARGHDGV